MGIHELVGQWDSQKIDIIVPYVCSAPLTAAPPPWYSIHIFI